MDWNMRAVGQSPTPHFVLRPSFEYSFVPVRIKGIDEPEQTTVKLLGVQVTHPTKEENLLGSCRCTTREPTVPRARERESE